MSDTPYTEPGSESQALPEDEMYPGMRGSGVTPFGRSSQPDRWSETSQTPAAETSVQGLTKESTGITTETSKMSSLNRSRSRESASTDVNEKFVDDSVIDMNNKADQVNVHQFYPVLEHTFNKAPGFVQDQQHQMEVAIREIVEDDSQFAASREETEGRSLREEELHLQLAGVTEGDDTDGNVMDDLSISRDKSSEPSAVFATAVDEETLEAAKMRSRTLFKPETWTPDRPHQPGMTEIISEKISEHLNMAHTMKETSDHQMAITCLSKAINLRGEEVDFYIKRAENYIQICDFQSAILNYKKACLLQPDNNELYSHLAYLYFFYGQILYDQHLYPEALESFSRAAEMQPDNISYHIRSISCLAALERHGECLALVNKRLEVDNNNPDLYVMRARLHEMFRNTTLCYYDVKDALALQADHHEARLMMNKLEKVATDNQQIAMQLSIQHKHREAIQKISIAIETNPSVAEYHILRGALHRKLGDYNAAIDDFLLALDKCDHNEEHPVYADSQRQLLLTYNDFAVECFAKGFYDEAIILLNKAIKGEKNERGLYLNRGDCFFKQNELNFALQDYHQALEIEPRDQAVKSRIAVIHNEYGYSCYQDKQYSEAESKLTLAIQYNPHVGQYYISRARARYMLENMTGARQDLIMGLLLDPTNDDIVSILSRLFPGKSVADVINSQAADNARIQLQNLATTAPPVRLNPMNRSNNFSVPVQKSSDGPVWCPDDVYSEFKLCVEEKEFNTKFATARRMATNRVKDALHMRKTLIHDGPRMQPLPPAVDKPKYGGRIFRKEEVIISPTRKKNKSTNWRTFSLGITKNN